MNPTSIILIENTAIVAADLVGKLDQLGDTVGGDCIPYSIVIFFTSLTISWLFCIILVR